MPTINFSLVTIVDDGRWSERDTLYLSLADARPIGAMRAAAAKMLMAKTTITDRNDPTTPFPPAADATTADTDNALRDGGQYMCYVWHRLIGRGKLGEALFMRSGLVDVVY